MVSKNNKKLIDEKNRQNTKQRFALRKLNVGVASVLLGITFSIYGGGQVVAHADTTSDSEHVATTSNDEALADKSEVTLQAKSGDEEGSQSSAAASDSETQSDPTVAEQQAASVETANTANVGSDAVKSDESKSDESTQTLDVKSEKPATEAELNASAVVATADAQDEDTVTVNTAQEFIDAIQKGNATTIKVANDLNLGDVHKAQNYGQSAIKNKRNITIQSSDGKRKTVDFNGYSFNMNNKNYSVTFKDLIIYGRNFFGPIENAGSFTFDNVDYTGSEMVYTTVSSTITFKNNVSAHTVDKYTSPLDGTEYATDKGQQVIQFTTGTNNVIFESGSNVTLTTDNGDVIKNSGNATTITVKNGANVTINPHASTKSFEANTGQVARGIVSAGGSINVEQGGNLTFNLSQNSGDPYMPGAIYLTKGATITDNGNIKINVNGQPSTGNSMPVYISGSSIIKVGNGATFEIAAQNLGSYAGSLFKIDGTGTVELDPHSTFKISGDGTGAVTGIELGTGSIFTSDQPKEFTIDLSANNSSGKALIKNGAINFTRVKNTDVDKASQVPLGEATVKYTNTGTLSSMKLTAEGRPAKTALKGLHTYIQNNLSKLSFVAAGEDVTLNDVHLSKDNKLTGIALSSGDSTNPIHIVVKINGETVSLPSDNTYQMYTLTADSPERSNVKDNGSLKNNGGEFTIDLSSVADKLTPGVKISVVATKDFVNSPTVEKTIEDLRAIDTATLKDLVDAAPTEKENASYFNATDEAKDAYDKAVKDGQTILDNISNNAATYDQSDIDAAVTAIQTAKNALNGEATDKTALQTAVSESTTTKSSENYTNADADKQQAYNAAITAGQEVLNNTNATQKQVNATLTVINNAKDALNGDAKKNAASKEALQQAVKEAPTVRTENSAYYNGTDDAKKAQDDGITNINNVKVPSLEDAKTAAKQVVDNALTKKLDEITANKNLTDEEKAKLTNDANTAATEAKAKIDATTTNDDATQAGQNGKAAIEAVNVPADSDAKKAAKDAIDAAAKAKNDLIDSSDLTDEEKNDLKKQVADAVKVAKDNIDAATKDAEVSTAQTNGEKAIDAVEIPASTSKTDAINAINEALDDKKTVINGADLTDEEKDALIDQAQKLANTAIAKVNEATTNDGVTTAKENGVQSIKDMNIPENSTAKQKAEASIDAAAEAAKNAIDNTNGLN